MSQRPIVQPARDGVPHVSPERFATLTFANRQPKVILLNRFFYPDESATSQLLTDLAFELVTSGHHVCVISGRAQKGCAKLLPRSEEKRGIHISRVRTALPRSGSVLGRLAQYASFYPGAAIRLWRLASPGDVIVAKTDPPLISVIAMIVARAKRAKLINWVQDLYPEVAAELRTPLSGGLLGRVLKAARNWALISAETDVAIGTRMAGELTKLGVISEKISVIPNWSDENLIRPLDPRESFARSEWGFEASDLVIGYSGNLGRAHEVDTLVGAAKILKHHTNIKFLFVGGGRQHEKLQQLIEREGLTSFVFKPHQPRPKLADSLAVADVHWISLRPELEGLIVPSKLYGILAAGRPVLAVCDEDGEVSRVVKEHDCGIIVQPGRADMLATAIKRLAEDGPYRRKLGRRARKVSETVFPRSSALSAWSEVISVALRGARGKSKAG